MVGKKTHLFAPSELKLFPSQKCTSKNPSTHNNQKPSTHNTRPPRTVKPTLNPSLIGFFGSSVNIREFKAFLARRTCPSPIGLCQLLVVSDRLDPARFKNSRLLFERRSSTASRPFWLAGRQKLAEPGDGEDEIVGGGGRQKIGEAVSNMLLEELERTEKHLKNARR